MSKAVKKYMTEELEATFRDLRDFVLVDYQGLTAEEARDFRDSLRQRNLSMLVVKNSLFHRALESLGLYGPGDEVEGPTGVVFGEEDAIGVARTLREWNKKNKPVPLKGGMLEGWKGGAEEAEAWASLPSRPEILSGLLGAFLAPARSVPTLFQATLAAFPGLVDAHVRKKEAEEEESDSQD